MKNKVSIYLTCKTSEMLRHFVFTTKTTQPCLQIFSVTRLIIWRHRHEFSLLKIPQNLVDGYDEIFLGSVLANQKRTNILNLNNKEYFPPTTHPFPASGWLLLGRKV